MEFAKRYYITTPIYELKYSEENDWNTVSENAALEDLLDNFERVTPKINEMLMGKEINTQRGIFRIKNYRELISTYRCQKV